MLRQKLTQKLLPLALIAVGLIVALLGVGSATWWRPDGKLTPQGSSASPLLVTNRGVLNAGADAVLMTATASDGNTAVIALGRNTDVLGWIGEAAHGAVTGLTSTTQLTIADEAGDETALPTPAGSDMWLVEASGAPTADLSWTSTNDEVVALIASVGPDGTLAGTVDLTLDWNVATPQTWLVPGLTVGGLLIVAGLVVAFVARRSSRREDGEADEPAAVADGEDKAADDSALTASPDYSPHVAPAYEGAAAADSTESAFGSAFAPRDDDEPSADTLEATTPAPVSTGALPIAPVEVAEPAAPNEADQSAASEPADPEPTAPEAAEPVSLESAAPEEAAEPAEPAVAEPVAPAPAAEQPLTRKRLRELKELGQLPPEYTDWGNK